MYDALFIGYLGGVFTGGIGGCLITLYVRRRYENALAAKNRQIEKYRESRDKWKMIANDRLPLRKIAAEERVA
jgi:hypothetical protein